MDNYCTLTVKKMRMFCLCQIYHNSCEWICVAFKQGITLYTLIICSRQKIIFPTNKQCFCKPCDAEAIWLSTAYLYFYKALQDRFIWKFYFFFNHPWYPGTNGKELFNSTLNPSHVHPSMCTSFVPEIVYACI